jgi:SAM-dependent methyltransferase
VVAVSEEVKTLLSPDRLNELTRTEPSILSTVGRDDVPGNRRFEGLYGRVYSRVIQTPLLRRAVFSAWGSADSLYHLEAFVNDAVSAARDFSATPVLVDLPSGSGSLLHFLAAKGFDGTVVEVDLAISMLRRAVALHRAEAPGLRTVFVQSDALDLPLRSGVADVIVSVNGLHVVPDHVGFLVEAARITKHGGKLWLITPVDGPSMRSRMILASANLLGITPQRPPALAELRNMLGQAGFREFRSYGGTSIVGLACERVY